MALITEKDMGHIEDGSLAFYEFIKKAEPHIEALRQLKIEAGSRLASVTFYTNTWVDIGLHFEDEEGIYVESYERESGRYKRKRI